MATRRAGEREPKGVPWNERVVVAEFDQCAQVELAFPGGPSPVGLRPAGPRVGEVVTATKWGRRWRTEGQVRVREVE